MHAVLTSNYRGHMQRLPRWYMFVISLFARNGFYVVLDNQLNKDPTVINDGEDAWLGYWRQIATAVAADEFAINKVIIDGLNVSTACDHLFRKQCSKLLQAVLSTDKYVHSSTCCAANCFSRVH